MLIRRILEHPTNTRSITRITERNFYLNNFFTYAHTHQLASLQIQRLGQSRGGEVHQNNFGSIWDLRESWKLTKSLEETA